MRVQVTRIGLRLSQHGIVLSELRTTPGPTHSVFDALAAAVASAPSTKRIGLLGFAGGSVMAPLRALGVDGAIDCVDLERAGHDLFRRHCHTWSGQVNWDQADAVDWLRRQPQNFDVLVEDLSVPVEGDVIKPQVSWDVLPELIVKRLAPGGVGIFNLLPTPGRRWTSELSRLAGLFGAAHVVTLDEFENRILIGSDELPETREHGVQLRLTLRRIRSRHAGRIHIQNLR